MTTTTITTTTIPRTKQSPAASPFRLRLPDPPAEQDEKMTNAHHLGRTGTYHHIVQHLGNPETTIVGSERFLIRGPERDMTGSRYPDLLVSFDADPIAYYRSNGYIISEQGKPPDFVLEIASASTGWIDVTDKRRDYARRRIREYWRFDETGRHHGRRLAGDRLVGDHYEEIPIDVLAADVLQGRSEVLRLDLRWEQGELGLYVPETGLHIATFTGERARANQAEAEAHVERLERMLADARAEQADARANQADARADQEQAARIQADARADQEQAARIQADARAEQEQAARIRAEARIRQLETVLRQLRNP